MTLEGIIAWCEAFINQIKPWIVGYVTFESYRAWSWKVFTFKKYLVRFVITIWFLYGATKIGNYFDAHSDIILFFSWGFSFYILDILEKQVPWLLKDKFNKLFNKNKKW